MQELIEKFLNRTISKSERKQLKKWVLANNDNLQVFKSEIKKRSENNLYHHFDESEAFQLFLASIDERKSKKIAVNRMLKYAAIVIGVLTVGILLTQFVGEPTEATIVQTEQQDSDAQEQITITLADGSQQVITQDGSAQLLDKNGRTIAQKQDKGLDFSNTSESGSSNLVFNEIYVPYGQTFKLTLSDGTKVWLNAGTSLRFPQFLNTSTQNRVVYLNGEAYFDVAKDKERPFIVNAENLDIEVLGTQFNVSAYKSDGEIATTLVEGSVSVYENSNPDTKVLLSPSYQASFVKENGSITKNKVDTRIYTGWMENLLIIDNLSFAQILDKLERSHNVSIINNATHLEGEIFNGEFENESINSILGTIASSTPFTYTIENNVITISK
ncbi:FecR family protein [Flagellimonas sp.]|uniref:FecR family protein n=1 Tax=Flagellimonas sp. TaxID=2058762 RepID=UPI003B51E991